MRLTLVLVCLITGICSYPVQADIAAAKRALAQQNYDTALREVRLLAQRRQAEAQYLLGIMYWKGTGVSKDLDLASTLLEQATDGHAPRAAFVRTVVQGEQRSLKRPAAPASGQFPVRPRETDDAYDPVEQRLIAKYLLDGENTRPDPEKALYWMRKAAAHGDSQAQFGLGIMYEIGIGAAPNINEAVKWYTFAAESDDSESKRAAEVLAFFFLEGVSVPKNDEKARYWTWKSGAPHAKHLLGLMYATGTGFPKDEKKAFELFEWNRTLAPHGIPESSLMVAQSYATGSGVKQNIEKAIKIYSEVANEGNDEAQLALGLIFSTGKLTAKDESLAATWFYKAAQSGNPKGQFHMGMAYASGRGVPQNTTLALTWLMLADQNGESGARAELNRLSSTLPVKAQTQAKALAAKWSPGKTLSAEMLNQ